MADPEKVVFRDFPLSLAPYHALNVLFSSLLLFVCASEHAAEGLTEYVCSDSVITGGGVIPSFLALLSGESDANGLALQSVAWYHFIAVVAQLRRSLRHQVLFPSNVILIITLVHLALFLFGISFVVKWGNIRLDTVTGAVSGAFFIASANTFIGKHVLRSIAKSTPVALMAYRLHQQEKKDDFTKRTALGLAVCAFADFALEYSFIGGLVSFLLGHLIFIYAFIKESSTTSAALAAPIIGYGVSIYVILLPNLGDLLIPVTMYLLVILIMLWRASLLGLDKTWGKLIALGALSFALSDTLIALHKFVGEIENVGLPIITLYWLGQGLIAKGTLERLKARDEAAASEKSKDQ